MIKLYALSILAREGEEGGGGPSLHSQDVVAWGVKNLVPLLLLVAGLGIIASARKGRMSENGNHVANIVLGLCVIAGAGGLYLFANDLTSLVFGSA